MDPIVAILYLVAPFIIYFILNKLVLGYFSRTYQKYGKNPITIVQQFAGALCFAPLVVALFDLDMAQDPIVFFGIPLAMFVFLALSNAYLKNPIRIIIMSIVQVVFGAMFVARMCLWIFLLGFSIIQNILFGECIEIKYNPFSVAVVDENGNIATYKGNISFKPDYNPDPVMVNMNKYTDSMNISRIAAEKRQLEKDLEDLRIRKQDAMIYGYEDIAGYETQEAELEQRISHYK